MAIAWQRGPPGERDPILVRLEEDRFQIHRWTLDASGYLHLHAQIRRGNREGDQAFGRCTGDLYGLAAKQVSVEGQLGSGALQEAWIEIRGQVGRALALPEFIVAAGGTGP